jgi:hypothetical protein
MRERLEKPYATKESLHWRLYGPVGVQALVQAIYREGHSDSERAFLFAELGLELARVKPNDMPCSLTADIVSGELKSFIKTLDTKVQSLQFNDMPDMHNYVSNAFKEAGK